jgi:hypothetical protein
VFLYHHAAATPPASAEAAAIIPTLSHSEAAALPDLAVGEVSDSKEFVTTFCAPPLFSLSSLDSRSICALDAEARGRFTFAPGNLISIFVFDFE